MRGIWRGSKQRGLVALLGALSLSTSGTGAADPGDPRVTESDVRARMFESPESLAAAAKEPNVFAPAFLQRVAAHYAVLMGGLPRGSRPFATSYLRDLEGRPSAFAAVFLLPVAGPGGRPVLRGAGECRYGAGGQW